MKGEAKGSGNSKLGSSREGEARPMEKVAHPTQNRSTEHPAPNGGR